MGKALELCVTPEEEARATEKQKGGAPDDGAPVDDSVQEHRRVTWLNHYIEESKYEEALELCVTPEEEERVAAKQETARLQWLGHYKEEGELNKALEMCVTYEEEAEIIGLMNPEQKSEAFVEAIKAYDWELAKQLAQTEQEHNDLTLSIARVEDMNKLKEAGDTEQALALAITQKERDDIKALKDH